MPIPAQRSVNFKQISSSSRKNIIYAMTNSSVTDDLVLNNDLGSVLYKPRSDKRQVNHNTNRGRGFQSNGRTLNRSSSKKIAPAMKLPAPSHQTRVVPEEPSIESTIINSNSNNLMARYLDKNCFASALSSQGKQAASLDR